MSRELPDALKKQQEEKRQITLYKIQDAINELTEDNAEVTKKKLINITGYSASTFSKPHVKILLEQNKVCQYKTKSKVKVVEKADSHKRYEQLLEQANRLINRLKEDIVLKDIKINKLEEEIKYNNEKYQILLGEVHQITRKAKLSGVDLYK